MKKVIDILFILGLVFVSQSCLRYHTGLRKVEDFSGVTTVFPDDFQKALYKSNIKFLNKDYSGLIFFKKKAEETRMVFMSEFGLKFFDLKLDNNGEVTVEYIIDELNKESVVGVLSQDFRLLFYNLDKYDYEKYYLKKKEGIELRKQKIGKYRYYYYNWEGKQQISNIELSGSIFKKIEIKLEEYNVSVPGKITINHRGLPLRLDLDFVR